MYVAAFRAAPVPPEMWRHTERKREEDPTKAMCHNFEELLSKNTGPSQKRVAVVWAGERHTLEAVLTAQRDCGIEPILIGDAAVIRQLLAELPHSGHCEIVDSESPEAAIQLAIQMVREKKADVIFKGLLQTATIMRAVVNKENGICKSGVLSHAAIMEIPGYHKLIALTDSALLTYPTLAQKRELLNNAVRMMRAIGVETPKVAVLAAVENVNPKMPETVDAAELKSMWQRGECPNCIVEGPVSYDLALDPEAAHTKGYQSPVAGDADILVVPNIQAGNMLVKSLVYSAHARSAGLIIGAEVPIIITSRSAPVANKSLAIAVACALGVI